jgi:pyrimidine oxygenase
VTANEAAGTQCGALVLTMIIADETDAAAMAKWKHYKTGTDHEAIAWRDSQFADDPTSDPLAGSMLTFDDCISGMERFGTRIQPLYGCARS